MKLRREYRSLHEYLDRTGSTQRRLAKKAGMSEQALSMLLRGSRRCSIVKALRLAKITGVPVENLIEWPKVHESSNSGEAA